MNEVYIYLNEDGTLDGWGDGYSENAIVVEYDPNSDLFSNHVNYRYVDGEFILDLERMEEVRQRKELALAQEEARIFLAQTQTIVQQHRDEIDLGVETTLTDAEYKALLRERIEKSKLLQVLS